MRIGDQHEPSPDELLESVATVTQCGLERSVVELRQRVVAERVKPDLAACRQQPADVVCAEAVVARRPRGAAKSVRRLGALRWWQLFDCRRDAEDRLRLTRERPAEVCLGDVRNRVGEPVVHDPLEILPPEGVRPLQRDSAQEERRRDALAGEDGQHLMDMSREVVVEGDAGREGLAAPPASHGGDELGGGDEPVVAAKVAELAREGAARERREDLSARVAAFPVDSVVDERHTGLDRRAAEAPAQQRGAKLRERVPCGRQRPGQAAQAIASLAVRTGVVVTGMDRSGTSATARLIALLGLHPPAATDLVAARDTNPTGVWESRSLASLNVRLLQAVGSDERFPLVLEPGWERDTRLDSSRAEAREAFGRSFPATPWVWKDPLHCLVLSFWRDVLADPLAVVLVTRNPLEIAASAERAWGREKIFGLALWERYLRQALWQIEGLPVLVTRYADVVDDPVAWARRTSAALGDAGVAVRGWSEEAVRAAVDTSLRHTEFTMDDLERDRDISVAQRELFEVLSASEGMHERFVAPALSDETPTTDALLSERRRTFDVKERLEAALEEERRARRPSRLRGLAQKHDGRRRWFAMRGARRELD